MEEDINILENAIKCNKKQFEEIGVHILLQDDEMKAIENLINRVKELEHQNNILKEKNQDYKCNYNTMAEQKEKAMERVKELEEYKEYYEDMEEVNKKFIAVDKIKEKIENYNSKGYIEASEALKKLLEE